MESLLGLKKTKSNLHENYKLVPWLNWEEWDTVRLSLFSASPDSVAKALRKVGAWRCRGHLPILVEVTASIVEIQQKDPHFRVQLSDGASDSEEMLAMLYTMAIMRLVNGPLEKLCKVAGSSIADAAEEIGMPRMLVDIRHEGSHRELPSLRLLRLASTKALDWLKSFYWNPQKNAIPCRSSKSANVRKEIKSKLREMAFCLKIKQSSGSSSSRIKGAKVHEQIAGATLHGRHKLFSLMASKLQASKNVGSSKQITRTLKHLVQLYSFFPSDVVSMLLEFLLDASNSTETVDSPKKFQINITLDVAHAVFDEWKPVIIKVCKKEPELLLTLLKAVLDMIESRKAIRDNFGSENFNLSVYDSEMERIGVLSSLFMWLVHVLKGLKLTQHEGQESLIDANGCLPKTLLIQLLRRCFHISDSENRELLQSALLLAEMVRDDHLSNKLHKLSSLTKLYPKFAEEVASDLNSYNYTLQDECIRQAAEKLELIKHHRNSNASVLSTQDETMEDTSIWTIAKSWKPCPIGMLPRAMDSLGCLPVLDIDLDCEAKASLYSMDPEKHLESKQSSKREASCDVDALNDSSIKRMRKMQSSDFSEPNNSAAITTSDGLKGMLLIGGIWQKVGNQELQDMKSQISILVTKR
ncbi:unnamed protein product [Amaranthus hypochondriacus]